MARRQRARRRQPRQVGEKAKARLPRLAAPHHTAGAPVADVIARPADVRQRLHVALRRRRRPRPAPAQQRPNRHLCDGVAVYLANKLRLLRPAKVRSKKLEKITSCGNTFLEGVSVTGRETATETRESGNGEGGALFCADGTCFGTFGFGFGFGGFRLRRTAGFDGFRSRRRFADDGFGGFRLRRFRLRQA